jgi:glycosyltransferase involved in cell wall biosynthesis
MRIVLAGTSALPDRMGGSERVIWELARTLAARGHVPLVLVPARGDRRAHSVHDGIAVRRYRDPGHSFATLYAPSIIAAGLNLRRAVRDWAADVVHAHHAISGAGAAYAGVPARCVTFYGPWHLEFLAEIAGRPAMPAVKRWTRWAWAPSKAALARRIERAAIHRSTHTAVLSRYSARQVHRVHGIPESSVTIVPGGVDLARFGPAVDRKSARFELGLPEGPLVFTVRRLVPRMGLEALIDAMTALPGLRLVIGGDGWLKPRLEARVAERRLGDRVVFGGFIAEDRLARYYQAADLVALPSVALEGFGLITLEALACGTPVVATPNSGAVDVLEPLEPSWISADASPAAIAATIGGALASTAAHRDEVSERCRAHAETYSWSRMAASYEALYR